MIEILTTGKINTVQDLGRKGWLDIGVSPSGAMDRQALETANLMLRNDPMAAAIEVALFPFRFRVDADIDIAVTGADCDVSIDGLVYPSWWAVTVRQGQSVTLEAPRAGARAYVAFAGGIDTPPVLGSRSTDLKSGFGGLNGGGLSRGDHLPLRPSARPAALSAGGIGVAWGDRPIVRDHRQGPIEIRVLPAAEYDVFTPESHDALVSSDWTVTAEANRMGYRLSGVGFALTQPLELLSHGIVPGTMQVPRSGQPIIQLADANTCGGYPKIATVIEADLPRLAQAPTGAALRFSLVTTDEAVDALRAYREAQDDMRAGIARLAGR